ncbi:hypothetical protein [Azospirillum sp. B510]|uniref:hypothetical protein n=1 Tax=Azospirillum sp. (strain B510) TaxID=137722 RepID=UPI0002D69FF2|nr:hypothetical protein [Azospirillum sp. B510]
MMGPSRFPLRRRLALLCALAAGGCAPPEIPLPRAAAPDMAVSTGGLPLAAYARPTGEEGVSLRLVPPADSPPSAAP